ncbi:MULTISPECIES: hypothetical protein [Methylobacteriaceae]|uniref:hypothetical protein n=1 Tax=Methylobacteriaceae TaxID=119045 RepID=UPI001170A323|nr:MULTISPECIES: hypothetical protein [Methylobacteriaceae]GEL42912.1 hypothetical protein MEX01_35030 [Methylorubrum extorquens]
MPRSQDPTTAQRIQGLQHAWGILVFEVCEGNLTYDDVTPIIDMLAASIDELKARAGDAPV